ncbi:DUF998 domain-containing protein [Promicromonospora panici]|uniref:DUF998 domain-containing protein n=1 Tax=Promicromonospora panici TaxID=2219658 RepID=UPI00101C1368|nr:DUF998 domain-containing protein [Promicromonospora panici]
MAQEMEFDRAAAVTRSMLGWGVVAGPFYLVIGLVLALTREGFDFSRHPLSVLMLGDGGWMQITNLALSGLMVFVAGVGMVRAGARGTGIAVGIYGVAMVASAIFPPDPMPGFPPGQDGATTPGISGILHLAFGAIGFIAFGVGALLLGGWLARHGERGRAVWSRVAGVVILVGFVGGVALGPAGVGGIWLAVVVGFTWLLLASIRLYREVPHPDVARR